MNLVALLRFSSSLVTGVSVYADTRCKGKALHFCRMFLGLMCLGSWLALCPRLSIAQSVMLDHLKSGMPSSEAASLGKFGDVPVSLSAGTAAITVPLYTVQSRSLSLPLQLKYHTGGIKVEELPSWVGLGWALEAGGVITRSVRGIPDENTKTNKIGYWHSAVLTGYDPDPQWGEGLYSYFEQVAVPSSGNPTPACVIDTYGAAGSIQERIASGEIDGQPDQFFFNFAGQSGSFIGGHTKPTSYNGDPSVFELTAMPHQHLRFAYEVTPTSTFGHTYDQYISKWIVTDANGTKYHFEALELTKSFTGEGVAAGASSFDPNGHTYASAWHLTKIESAMGQDTITLTYTPHTYEQTHRDRREWTLYTNASNNGDDLLLHSKSQITAQRLTHIQTDLERVVFETTALMSNAENPSYQLDKVQVKNVSGTNLRREYRLAYTGGTANNRLKLSNVTEYDALGNSLPPYVFTYNATLLPSRLSHAVDHWGYYNGKLSNDLTDAAHQHSPLPTQTITWTDLLGEGEKTGVLMNVQGADKTPDMTYTQAEILEKVHYPLGGSTTFTYEPNDYYFVRRTPRGNQGTSITGGVRLKTLAHDNGLGDVMYTDYLYTYDQNLMAQFVFPDEIWQDRAQLHGKSTGVVVLEPQYTYYHHTGGVNFISVSDQSLLPLGGGQNLTYQAVTVVKREGTTFGVGPTEVHTFATANGYYSPQASTVVGPAELELHQDACLPNDPDYNTWDQERYFRWNGFGLTRYDWLRGWPLGIGYYKDGTTLVRRKEFGYDWGGYEQNYFYAINGQNGLQKRTHRFPALQTKNFIGYSTPKGHLYEIIASFHPRSREEDYNCDSGTCRLAYKKTSLYDVNQYPHYLLSVTEDPKTSYSSIRKTTYRYAAQEHSGLRDAHILAPVYSTTTLGGWGATATLAKNWTVWNNNDGYWRPREEWQWTGSYPSDPNAPTHPGPSEPETRKVATYEAYDAYGHVLEQSDAHGEKAYFFYGSQSEPFNNAAPGLSHAFLTGVILLDTDAYAACTTAGTCQQVTDCIQQGNCLHTSYDYYTAESKFGRVKTVALTNGIEEGFDYDTFGRLTKLQRGGTNLTEYSYTPFSGTPGTSAFAPAHVQTQSYHAGSPMIAKAFVDGLGRAIQSQVSENGGTHIVSATTFDALGRPSKTWSPYRAPTNGQYQDASQVAAGTSSLYNMRCSSTAVPYQETLYEASALNRPEQIIPPHCTGSSTPTSFSYAYELGPAGYYTATTTTVAPYSGQNAVSRTRSDGFGQVVEEINPESGSTTYYYNDAGHLTVTKSPNNLYTRYDHDRLGQLVKKQTPDADATGDNNTTNDYAGDYRYRYNDVGQLRFEKDPNRYTTGYLYTDYDAYGRVREVGLCTNGNFDSADVNAPACAGGIKAEVISYTYDTYATSHPVPPGVNTSYALGNLTEVVSDNGYEQFFYDNHGQVADYYLYLNGLGGKLFSYRYDLQGKVTKISYQKNEADAYFLWYYYDAMGRLNRVTSHTADDEAAAADELSLTFTPTGKVEQLQLGNDPAAIPPITYTYQIRDWLASINDPANLGTHQFAMALGYGDEHPGSYHNFSGNIAWVDWRIAGNDTYASHMAFNYYYDRKGQLITTQTYTQDNGTWTASPHGAGNYNTQYQYDTDGNITTIQRYRPDGNEYVWNYYITGSNRLSSINHWSSDASGTGYTVPTYDRNGNMTLSRGNVTLAYNRLNLPNTIQTNTATIQMGYDANGQRIKKHMTFSDNTQAAVYYVRGLDGQVMAVYDQNGTLAYWNLLANGSPIGRAEPPAP